MANEEILNSMDELLKDYDVKKLNRGDILKGTVIDVNDKEVSVNINYAFDGLISKEEVSSDEKDPRDVVAIGDEIEVYVISPNDGDGYVELSLKRSKQIKEKENIKDAFKNGNIVSVKIKEEIKGGLAAYYGNLRVFIPGSLASRERIELSTLVGKEIDVKITELDLNNNKIVASRRVIEEEEYNKNKKVIWNSLQ